jgi:hypothetical protein
MRKIMQHLFENGGTQMATPAVSSIALLPAATRTRSAAPLTRGYVTNTSFVAVHFDEAGKGQMVTLPKGGTLRIVGPSSCLREGFEVTFEKRIYHVFEIDLMARAALIFERIGTKRRAMAACG